METSFEGAGRMEERETKGEEMGVERVEIFSRGPNTYGNGESSFPEGVGFHNAY